ncbi:MAG TPA: hypothetical protein PK950_02465 [Candidatus Paceibacterota bacterium]|nr:hypothetical protein [Candidatus Paceibacterota bacterium]
MQGRIAFSIFVVLLGFLAPWWVAFIFFALGSYLYAPWFELIVIGLFYDLVFSVDRMSFGGFEFVYAAWAIVCIALMYIIKKRFLNV